MDAKHLKLACVLQDDAFVLYSLNNMSVLLEVRNKSNGVLLENIAVPASLSGEASISNFCPSTGNGVLSYIVSSTTNPGSVYQCEARGYLSTCLHPFLHAISRLVMTASASVDVFWKLL